MDETINCVRTFLVQQRIKPAEIKAAEAKMAKFLDEKEIFKAGKLEQVMGNELAQAFRKACAEKPSPMPK